MMSLKAVLWLIFSNKINNDRASVMINFPIKLFIYVDVADTVDGTFKV